MMTGPQADFWFPVTAETAAYTGQWYSENTMQGILAYRGQVTQALPGQTNRLVATIGDKQALGGYVKVNEWNDYEVIARGGVMMHIMNGQLMGSSSMTIKTQSITNWDSSASRSKASRARSLYAISGSGGLTSQSRSPIAV